MARLHDSHGTLLGGLHTMTPAVRPPSRRIATHTGRAQCSYGSTAFAYQVTPLDVQIARYQPRTRLCRNRVKPGRAYHCHACGGDYCSAHAAPSAHDCTLLIPRP